MSSAGLSVTVAITPSVTLHKGAWPLYVGSEAASAARPAPVRRGLRASASSAIRSAAAREFTVSGATTSRPARRPRPSRSTKTPPRAMRASARISSGFRVLFMGRLRQMAVHRQTHVSARTCAERAAPRGGAPPANRLARRELVAVRLELTLGRLELARGRTGLDGLQDLRELADVLGPRRRGGVVHGAGQLVQPVDDLAVRVLGVVG